MERYAILVAGGKGLRMGGDIPKQFLPIGGKPVLMRTIEVFCQAYPDIHIILVLPVSQQDYWQQLCQDYHFTNPVLIADGGETRFHSVSNGLKLIPEDAEGIVGVHDGVRPFVSVETIRRCYDEAVELGAVVPVVSVVETVRQLLKDGTSVTVPRDEYKLVQTPQTFRISLLKEAYQQQYTSFFTDDASVVEALGKPVHLVEGNRENIKITTPADIRFVNGLL
jgi:2-C-methyl-D-erythritol 4-phosphate cytidylyltransferase